MVRVGIVGSRSFRNSEQVKDYVKSLDKDTIIVSGGGNGVGKTVRRTGEALGMKVVSFIGDGIKNICEYSDMICAFWDGKSKETKNTIDLAKKMNMIVQVITEE